MDESMQSKGGRARAKALSATERSEIAKKAAEARWSPDILNATHPGTLQIGDAEISCAVLEDGETHVLTRATFVRAIGRRGKVKGGRAFDKEFQLPVFLTADNLKPFIPKELEENSKPVLFRLNGQIAIGYRAELLPLVCQVFMDARYAKKLRPNQEHIAEACRILYRGFATIGLIALIDEATGFQSVRAREALQALLDKFLRKELAAWAKRFPDEFYEQIYRLKNWEWKGMSKNRYSVVAKYTIDLVYERILPSLLKELEERNPKDDRGRRKGRHHQLFTEDVGHPALAQHLYALIGFMRASSSWNDFYRLVNRAFPRKGNNLELPFTEKASTATPI
ncbi:MAG: P63C domain-containing protein [Candidatus Binatus sp.]|uniref:P63C domain-containing protein n=1 Tax=Candidatus Binatus sp. TaxID=2811406 RepID=UPI00271D54DB|nr:P63C domain-containing protein [Candidatus Binatus sp.]MDO8430962.1 P63C domain-containing protein [Candidatus Binatus sp.]